MGAEGVEATTVCPTFNEDRVDDFVALLLERAEIGGGGGGGRRGAMRESADAELGPEDKIPTPETFAGVVALPLNDVLIMSPAFFLIVLTPPK